MQDFSSLLIDSYFILLMGMFIVISAVLIMIISPTTVINVAVVLFRYPLLKTKLEPQSSLSAGCLSLTASIH